MKFMFICTWEFHMKTNNEWNQIEDGCTLIFGKTDALRLVCMYTVMFSAPSEGYIQNPESMETYPDSMTDI